MKRTRRPLDLRRAVGSALLLLLWVLGGPVPAGAAEPDPVQRAGLVIVQADGSPALHCVAFDGPEIDGLALLRQAGVQLTVSAGSAGTAICAIDDTGCPASDCFCACKAAPCRYWTYFHAAGDGGWVYSGRGAAGWSLRDGDVDAWVWGDSSAAPPDVTFVEICGGETEPPPGTTTPVLEIATPETTPDVTP
ncbi:MAG: hypothetical protein JXB35_03200, partial [Anaerolineae bacterium]|nr:hypothetical protein [Anaerolineae bacterium]